MLTGTPTMTVFSTLVVIRSSFWAAPGELRDCLL
jgi:hypothetical protein